MAEDKAEKPVVESLYRTLQGSFPTISLNLIKAIPEFADTIIEEHFANREMKLTCIAV